MEYAKLANGRGHELLIERTRSRAEEDRKEALRTNAKKLVPKKATPRKARQAQLLGTNARKSKSDKLVCRYCGSDDLAPSFMKRRDRRCRKCFSNRYGSAAETKMAKFKK